MNPNLKNLLDETGIDPAPKNENFNPAPNEILEDFFGYLGTIFAPKPFHEDRKRNYKEAKKKEDNDKKNNKDG